MKYFWFLISQSQINLDIFINQYDVIKSTFWAVFMSSNFAFAVSSFIKKIRIKLIRPWGIVSRPTLKGLLIGSCDINAHRQSAFSRNKLNTDFQRLSLTFWKCYSNFASIWFDIFWNESRMNKKFSSGCWGIRQM